MKGHSAWCKEGCEDKPNAIAQLAQELKRYTEEAGKLSRTAREQVFQRIDNCHDNYNTKICKPPIVSCWRNMCFTIAERSCRNA